MCGTVGADPADPAGEELEAAAALLARAEQECMPTQMPSTGLPAATRSRIASSRPFSASPRAALSTWPTPAMTASGASRTAARRCDRRLGSGPGQGRGDGAEVAGSVVGEHDFHAMPFVERMPPSPGATACRNAWPSALNAASATWWSSAPGDSTWTVQPASIAKRSRECGRSDSASPPTRSPVNASAISACGAPDEVDGSEGARLVHRDDRGAVAREALARAECLLRRRAERGQDVLDRVVLVDVDVAARDTVEVEAGVEGEQREEMVEEADPRRDM